MAATVDHISGGRFDLGLGWGSAEDEFERFGVAIGSRRERAEALGETIEIFRLMCAGEPFDYDGKHFRLRGAYGLPIPVQERIPVHIGGGLADPATLERFGQDVIAPMRALTRPVGNSV
jgi:alkanesulfonate monooxygenase SsuD/methylene tetrahydromethanopterin reductase-like flavin-dependent oxidoreductase (luciferase family)